MSATRKVQKMWWLTPCPGYSECWRVELCVTQTWSLCLWEGVLRLPPPPPVFACAFKWAICYAEQAVQAHAEDWLHKERRPRLLPGFPVTMPSIGAACSTGQSDGDRDDHHLLKSLPGLPFEAAI